VVEKIELIVQSPGLIHIISLLQTNHANVHINSTDFAAILRYA